MALVNRPSSSPGRAKSEPSPPRMCEYAEKVKDDEISKSGHIRKFTLDWMGMDAPSDSYMKDMFDYFDKDKSGSLDKKEMMAVFAESFENYGAPVDQRDMDRLFSKFDRDRSGKINFDEFCVLMLNRLKM